MVSFRVFASGGMIAGRIMMLNQWSIAAQLQTMLASYGCPHAKLRQRLDRPTWCAGGAGGRPSVLMQIAAWVGAGILAELPQRARCPARPPDGEAWFLRILSISLRQRAVTWRRERVEEARRANPRSHPVPDANVACSTDMSMSMAAYGNGGTLPRQRRW